MTEDAGAQETQQEALPPPPSRFVFVGFNAAIDRFSINKLMGTVSIILERRPRPDAIILCISSEGGMLDAAFYGYEILRGLPMGIGTHNVGLVASAANVLFMAGNVRTASPDTSFLFHESRFPVNGPGIMSQDDLRLSVEGMKNSDVKTADIIAGRINKPAAEVNQWFSEEFRSADFALRHGIISSINQVAIRPQDDFIQVPL